MKPYFKNRCFYARSLKTKRKIVAISYSRILYKKFYFIKSNIKMDMQKDIIIKLVDDFTNQVFHDAEENLYNTSNIMDTPFYLMLEDTIKGFQNSFNTKDYTNIANEVDTIISKLETPVNDNDIEIISEHLLNNHINNLKIIKKSIETQVYNGTKPNLAPNIQYQSVSTISDNSIIPSEVTQSITVNELDTIYTQYKKHSIKKWSKDTLSNNDVVSYILNLFFGKSKNINTFKYAELLDLINILYDIPNRLTLRKEFIGKDLNYILDHSEEIETISIRTINKYISTLNRFLKYCHQLQYMPNLLKLDKIDITSIAKARIAYEDEDLKLISSKLSDIEYENQLIILIALYSGLRLGEITQLRKCDIKLDPKTKIFYFDINVEDGKKVKNKTSIRKVPIHPYICSELENHIINFKDKDNIFTLSSVQFSKWYRIKFNRKFITNDKRKVFHSFRHNAVTNMLENNCSLDAIAAVVGHSQDLGMTFHYGGNAIPLEQLKETVFSIKYSEI